MRQGPQINIPRPSDAIEVIRTACPIWVIAHAHVYLLIKAGAVPSTGSEREMIPPLETPWKHWSEGPLS